MPLFKRKKPCPSQNEDGTVEVGEACYDEFMASNPRMVVMFYRSTCGHCQKMEPVFAALCSEMAGKLVFCKVDVMADWGLAKRYSVKATPTFLVIKDKGAVASVVGEPTKEQLRQEMEKAI